MALQNYRFILRCVDELGLILRNIIIWYKPNHMPSSVKDRFTNAYEPVFMLVKSKKYWFDLDAVRAPHNSFDKEMQRSILNNKGNYAARPDLCRSREEYYHPLGKNPGDLWAISTQPFPEAHFATFPEKLVEPMIKVGCPQWICSACKKPKERIMKTIGYSYYGNKRKRANAPGAEVSPKSVFNTGIVAEKITIGWTDCGCNAGWESGVVLDPFLGSGTTALVALKLGRRFVGIEINREYCEMALRRIKPLIAQSRLIE